jgi:KUP system potassium uptake protein
MNDAAASNVIDDVTEDGSPEARGKGIQAVGSLTLGALGVVYGDIGTSPLYAFRQCFHGAHAVAPTHDNILGVLSLIVWALVLVVSVKYLLFVLQADNRGEGGIIALVALLNPWRATGWSRKSVLMLLGLFGAALLYGDGTITPAISVLSAVEGLEVATSAFHPAIIPLTLAILIGLFAVQRHGTSKIAALFGPIMLAWFVMIGVLGLISIWRQPGVLMALHPAYGLAFLVENGMHGFIILGTVFLAVTGAEILYADMGHFGRKPIRLAWFGVALPGLLLNYFGQGALVLRLPEEIVRPFYHLGPSWALYPMVAFATVATVIASQAVISGTFSLTRQALQLGQLPKLTIIQTNAEQIGQIYVPAVNWTLMVATIGLVLTFRSSSNLASAYGIAVSADMVITTILSFFVALRWGWKPIVAGLFAFGFLIVDLAFLAANMFKIVDGGWYPLLVATVIFGIMAVWRSGRRRLKTHLDLQREPTDAFLKNLATESPHRVSGTAVFLASSVHEMPSTLIHHLEHNRVLHERVILLTIVTDDQPRVPTAERLKITKLTQGFYQVSAHYGFMQSPNVPVILRLCSRSGLEVDPDQVTYYVGREEIVPKRTASAASKFGTRLFDILSRNAVRPTAFFNLPSDRVVELGNRIEI